MRTASASWRGSSLEIRPYEVEQIGTESENAGKGAAEQIRKQAQPGDEEREWEGENHLAPVFS